jgi:hypothetical protein
VILEFCTGDCDQRTREREFEISLLLEAVVRELLLKIEKAVKT